MNSGQLIEPYRLYAIKYMRRTAARCDHFVDGDRSDAAPFHMDFYIWVAIRSDHIAVIDTGFNEEIGRRRNRPLIRCPIESLNFLNINADEVDDVIITHVHYDHAGNIDKFPRAKFHIQEAEVHYASGRYMGNSLHSRFIELQDVYSILKMNFSERLEVSTSFTQIRPGLEAYPVGGHTPGMQFVRVFTQRGWVILASDVAHLYEHIEKNRIFPAAFDEKAAVNAYQMVRAMAESANHIIPGHDPLVLEIYPSPTPRTEGIVAELHAIPTLRN